MSRFTTLRLCDLRHVINFVELWLSCLQIIINTPPVGLTGRVVEAQGTQWASVTGNLPTVAETVKGFNVTHTKGCQSWAGGWGIIGSNVQGLGSSLFCSTMFTVAFMLIAPSRMLFLQALLPFLPVSRQKLRRRLKRWRAKSFPQQVLAFWRWWGEGKSYSPQWFSFWSYWLELGPMALASNGHMSHWRNQDSVIADVGETEAGATCVPSRYAEDWTWTSR